MVLLPHQKELIVKKFGTVTKQRQQSSVVVRLKCLTGHIELYVIAFSGEV